MSLFKKAQKSQTRARIALVGPSGSGKTYTGLLIAKSLGKKIAVIDTERGSASKYAGDVADFDVAELGDFSPKSYLAALKEAAQAGYDVVVIDSLSHAWMGKGGILEQKDKSGSGFDGWRKLTPLHNEFVEGILSYPGHVIATLRTKTEYVVEKDANGKSVPRKIGLAPVQRDGIEFEFDIVADMDADNTWRTSKSRCPALNGRVINQPDAEVGREIRAWLDDGATSLSAPAPEVPEAPAAKPAPPPPAAQHRTAQQVCAAVVTQIRDAAGQNYEGKLRAEVTNLLNDTDPARLDTETAKALLGTQPAPGPLRALRDAVVAGTWGRAAPAPIPTDGPRSILLAQIPRSRQLIADTNPGPTLLAEADAEIGTRPLDTVQTDRLKAIKVALEGIYDRACEPVGTVAA